MLNLTTENLQGLPKRITDREAEDDLALTRREHWQETDGRRHTQARNEVRERYSINVTPLAQLNDYAVLAAKHLDIGTRRAKLDREQSETVTALARGLASFNEQKVEHQAQSLINGSSQSFHGFEELKSRAARLGDEVLAHSEALRMLREQMDNIKSDRSIDVAEQVHSAHVRAVSEIADASATLLRALRDEALIREIVTNAGYDGRLPTFQGIMDIATIESRARDYVR